ncbi:MAG: restriction endonuclease subunit S [Enterobacteriaceae bacterium]|nr:restriction endonuclease subunit S [Enterobacteriaceae bacterium]
MTKYKAYPEYKDSGIEWLGELPNHWTTLAIKHVAQLNPSKSCVSIEKMKGMCSFIPMEKLKFNSLSLDEIKDVPDVYNGYTYFENEDILVAKVTPCFENKNMVVAHDLHNGIGFGSSEIYVLRCNDIIKNDFLFYRLQEDNFMSIAEGAMTGAGGLKRVPSEVLNNFKFGLPGKKEQSIIVDFLKHETAKIDNLIEKQQQLIELLKEKRQAVISHAVTKGLNPDAPMKDSGVEWLGKVPEHWEVSKFGYISLVVRGGSPRPAGDPTLFNGDYSPWVTVAEITKDNEIYLDSTDTFLTKKGSEQCRVFKAGTLLISNSGATLGVPKILNIDANANDGVVGFELLNIDHEYAYFYLSTLTINLRESIKQGSGQPNLNTDIVKSIAIPIPPEKEIQQIVSFIKETIKLYLSMESGAMEQVKLLQERRTALISGAVTGKIDVRDWVSPDMHDIEALQEATV